MEFLIKIGAILIASLLGNYPVKYLLKYLGSQTEDEKTAAWVGILERVMYMGAWFLGYPQFIAVWLTAKVVGRWGERAESRGKLGRFLFGAGLSISIAVVFALVAEWLITKI